MMTSLRWYLRRVPEREDKKKKEKEREREREHAMSE
jgi:hypothetical protein